jgi:hypothetical protein
VILERRDNPKRNEHRKRNGFTLLELCVVFFFFSVAVLLITVTIVSTLNLQRTSSELFASLGARNQLAAQFRDDVGRADRAPDSLESEHAGPDRLILRRPSGEHVIYRWGDGKLERQELTAKTKSIQRLALGSDRVSVQFARTGAGNRLITLRLIGMPPEKLGPPFEVSAALGGGAP